MWNCNLEDFVVALQSEAILVARALFFKHGPKLCLSFLQGLVLILILIRGVLALGLVSFKAVIVLLVAIFQLSPKDVDVFVIFQLAMFFPEFIPRIDCFIPFLKLLAGLFTVGSTINGRLCGPDFLCSYGLRSADNFLFFSKNFILFRIHLVDKLLVT